MPASEGQPRRFATRSRGLTALVRANYYGRGALQARDILADDETFGAKVLFDVDLGYQVTKNLQLTVGADNLLNTFPDKNTKADQHQRRPLHLQPQRESVRLERRLLLREARADVLLIRDARDVMRGKSRIREARRVDSPRGVRPVHRVRAARGRWHGDGAPREEARHRRLRARRRAQADAAAPGRGRRVHQLVRPRGQARLAAAFTPTSRRSTTSVGSAAVYYIAMEHVDGFDVRKMLRYSNRHKEPLPLNVVMSILCELCDALEYAHTFVDEHGQPQGIVHRDVSPSNLIVAQQRSPQGDRLRDRQGERPPAPHRERTGQGQARLHVARGGDRAARSARCPTCSRPAWSRTSCSPRIRCSRPRPTTTR